MTTLKLTLWHESAKLFDFPNRAGQVASWHARPAKERTHGNSLLGLWCATTRPIGVVFGEHLYRVDTLVAQTETASMLISELRVMSNRYDDDLSKWDRQRDSYLGAGIRLIRLVESNGKITQSIVLDYGIIKRFAREER